SSTTPPFDPDILHAPSRVESTRDPEPPNARTIPESGSLSRRAAVRGRDGPGRGRYTPARRAARQPRGNRHTAGHNGSLPGAASGRDGQVPDQGRAAPVVRGPERQDVA